MAYSFGMRMVSRLVLSYALLLFTETTSASQTFCPFLPSATPFVPASGSGRNSYGIVTVAVPSPQSSSTRKIACPEQLATHIPQLIHCEFSTTIGREVMFDPMEIQPFGHASWQGLHGMFCVHSITGCTPTLCVTPGKRSISSSATNPCFNKFVEIGIPSSVFSMAFPLFFGANMP